MKYLTILLAFLLLGCGAYNFEYGSSLADFQDKKFQDYKAGKGWTAEEEARFKNNMWARMACELAPGNLPVRHYCLIDLFEGKANHTEIIGVQLDSLGDEIWREGYSYWLYTKPFLEEYAEKFKQFGLFIIEMEKKFQETAYIGPDGKLYPAPYGDLRHQALEMDLQTSEQVSENEIVFPLVIKIFGDTIEYTVEPCALGFNTHVPKEKQVVRVYDGGTVSVVQEDGTYKPFQWYQGYDKKYKDKEAEFNDTFDPARINSLNIKKLWKEYEKIFMNE